MSCYFVYAMIRRHVLFIYPITTISFSRYACDATRCCVLFFVLFYDLLMFFFMLLIIYADVAMLPLCHDVFFALILLLISLICHVVC